MEPQRYRKKPVVIEAVHLDVHSVNPDEVAQWCGGEVKPHPDKGYIGGPFTVHITTLEGVMVAEPGDYVIRGVQGEFYPCKPDIFEATYEAA
ncbi:hypothetical protein [Nocardiopsis alba]|uniref:Uncharacterized protein n=1 Tax=Nocardiopsis alba TaxID=53437 RepID=A0A7K2ILB2_9ACTN|nr:hypothetical protein [Nocardiopsis alba]MYR30751.1 hypothetical protein [Nocardiopsis alba]